LELSLSKLNKCLDKFSNHKTAVRWRRGIKTFSRKANWGRFGDPSVNDMIILKRPLKIQDVKFCTEFIWLRVRPSSGLTLNERFHSMKLINSARACVSVCVWAQSSTHLYGWWNTAYTQELSLSDSAEYLNCGALGSDTVKPYVLFRYLFACCADRMFSNSTAATNGAHRPFRRWWMDEYGPMVE